MREPGSAGLMLSWSKIATDLAKRQLPSYFTMRCSMYICEVRSISTPRITPRNSMVIGISASARFPAMPITGCPRRWFSGRLLVHLLGQFDVTCGRAVVPARLDRCFWGVTALQYLPPAAVTRLSLVGYEAEYSRGLNCVRFLGGRPDPQGTGDLLGGPSSLPQQAYALKTLIGLHGPDRRTGNNPVTARTRSAGQLASAASVSREVSSMQPAHACRRIHDDACPVVIGPRLSRVPNQWSGHIGFFGALGPCQRPR